MQEARKKRNAHEIGGNFGYICAFFFSFLWVVFIFLCITQNYGHIDGWQPATIRSSTVLADIDGQCEIMSAPMTKVLGDEIQIDFEPIEGYDKVEIMYKFAGDVNSEWSDITHCR